MSNETAPGVAPSVGVAGVRTLEWAQVDVFAESALEGNMLAIFPDATGLTDAEMQALARETNLSETTFLFPQAAEVERTQGVRVRIFTTEEELPFAGHPTLGTASWLKLHHPVWQAADRVVLQLNAGPVPVTFAEPPAHDGSIQAEMTQADPHLGAVLQPAHFADALGLAAQDFHPSLAPQVVSTGLPFAIVPLTSLQALQSVRVNHAALTGLLEAAGAKFVYCLAQRDALSWEARMPFYGTEDPATGSAAGCAISYLVARGAAPPQTPVEIFQGRQVHRPSRILAQAGLRDGRVNDVRIAGRTIPVAMGRFLLH